MPEYLIAFEKNSKFEQKESEAEDLAEFLLSWSVYVFVLVFQRLVQTRENV